MADVSVLLFRKDLRVHDHAALNAACASGRLVLPLYIFDPSDWRGKKSRNDYTVFCEAHRDLDAALRARGARLITRIGNPASVLARLHISHGIASLHAHAVETDKTTELQANPVMQWACRMGIPVREFSQTGILASHGDPHELDMYWNTYMTQPRSKAPAWIQAAEAESAPLPILSDLDLAGDISTAASPARREHAVRALSDAFNIETTDLQTAQNNLKFTLAWGLLSPREVYQTGVKHIRAARAENDIPARKRAEQIVRQLNTICLGNRKAVAALALSEKYRMASAPLRRHKASLTPQKTHKRPAEHNTNQGQQLCFDWSDPPSTRVNHI